MTVSTKRARRFSAGIEFPELEEVQLKTAAHRKALWTLIDQGLLEQVADRLAPTKMVTDAFSCGDWERVRERRRAPAVRVPLFGETSIFGEAPTKLEDDVASVELVLEP